MTVIEKKVKAFDLIQRLAQMQIDYQEIQKELIALQEEIKKEDK